jgi:hypothetical protein
MIRTVIRSARRAASLSCDRKPSTGKLVTNRPARSPGAVASAASSSRPSGRPRSSATDFLPLLPATKIRAAAQLVDADHLGAHL